MTDKLKGFLDKERPAVPARTDSLDTNVSVIKDSNEPKLIEVVRNSILLEQSVHTDMTEFCDQEKIIKAAWIEEAFRELQKSPKIMQKVVSGAKKRVQERKNAARYRQAKTFSKKLEGL